MFFFIFASLKSKLSELVEEIKTLQNNSTPAVTLDQYLKRKRKLKDNFNALYVLIMKNNDRLNNFIQKNTFHLHS